MKPRPVIRKAVKWGGAVATVLLMVSWLGSRWWRLSVEAAWGGGGRTGMYERVVIQGGLLLVQLRKDPTFDPPVGAHKTWRVGPAFPTVFHWWFDYYQGLGGMLAIPLWVPAVCALVPSGVAWRLDALARRRARATRCPKCGYDRRGIDAAGPCPECGSAPPATPAARV